MSDAPILFDDPGTRCPLCACGRIDHFRRITHPTRPFTVDRCHECGFIFMNPRFSDATLASFYGEDYYGGTAAFAYEDERTADRYYRFVWDSRVNRIAREIPDGNFLDVGCSFGGLLSSAARYYQPYGIEISPYAGAAARERFGASIHIGTLTDHPFPPGFFSVITMIEVIEHIPAPCAALEECRRLLAPGGLLVIQTANMEGCQARIQGSDYGYYLPGHCSYFSRRNLAGALAAAGFHGIRTFYPVEFGLLPKLKKSRHAFRSLTDYRRWIKIALYHGVSQIHWGDCAATSAMVIFASMAPPHKK